MAFPICSISQLLECLTEMKVQLTKQDLVEPSYPRSRVILEDAIKFVSNVSLRDPRPAFAAMDVFEFQELHDQMGEFESVRHIVEMLQAAGVQDASMRDVLQPDKKRMVFLLSAIVNLGKFREERMDAWHSLRLYTETKSEECAKLREENELLTQEFNRLREMKDQEAPVLQTLHAEVAEIEGQLEPLKQQSVHLKLESNTLKQKLAVLQERNADTNVTLINTRETVTKLRSQVVKSPERVKRNLADLSATVAEEKKQLAEANARLKEMQLRKEAYEKCARKLDKRVQEVDDCIGEVQRCKRQSKAVKDEVAKKAELDQRVQEAVQKTNQTKVKLASGQGRLGEMQQRFETSRRQFSSLLEEREATRAQLELEKTKEKIELDEAEAEKQRQQLELQSMEETHEKEMTRTHALFKSLEAALDNYHHELVEAMNRPLAA